MNHGARAGYGPVGSPCEMDEKSEDDQGTTPGLDRPPVRVREGSWTHLTMNRPVTAGGHLKLMDALIWKKKAVRRKKH
ncbi:MAG: hypothetical protein ACOCTR_05380 [Candidatus Natronoplasma sp.]